MYLLVIGDTRGEIPPSRSSSASWSDVLRAQTSSRVSIGPRCDVEQSRNLPQLEQGVAAKHRADENAVRTEGALDLDQRACEWQTAVNRLVSETGQAAHNIGVSNERNSCRDLPGRSFTQWSDKQDMIASCESSSKGSASSSHTIRSTSTARSTSY